MRIGLPHGEPREPTSADLLGCLGVKGSQVQILSARLESPHNLSPGCGGIRRSQVRVGRIWDRGLIERRHMYRCHRQRGLPQRAARPIPLRASGAPCDDASAWWQLRPLPRGKSQVCRAANRARGLRRRELGACDPASLFRSASRPGADGPQPWCRTGEAYSSYERSKMSGRCSMTYKLVYNLRRR